MASIKYDYEAVTNLYAPSEPPQLFEAFGPLKSVAPFTILVGDPAPAQAKMHPAGQGWRSAPAAPAHVSPKVQAIQPPSEKAVLSFEEIAKMAPQPEGKYQPPRQAFEISLAHSPAPELVAFDSVKNDSHNLLPENPDFQKVSSGFTSEINAYIQNPEPPKIITFEEIMSRPPMKAKQADKPNVISFSDIIDQKPQAYEKAEPPEVMNFNEIVGKSDSQIAEESIENAPIQDFRPLKAQKPTFKASPVEPIDAPSVTEQKPSTRPHGNSISFDKVFEEERKPVFKAETVATVQTGSIQCFPFNPSDAQFTEAPFAPKTIVEPESSNAPKFSDLFEAERKKFKKQVNAEPLRHHQVQKATFNAEDFTEPKAEEAEAEYIDETPDMKHTSFNDLLNEKQPTKIASEAKTNPRKAKATFNAQPISQNEGKSKKAPSFSDLLENEAENQQSEKKRGTSFNDLFHEEEKKAKAESAIAKAASQFSKPSFAALFAQNTLPPPVAAPIEEKRRKANNGKEDSFWGDETSETASKSVAISQEEWPSLSETSQPAPKNSRYKNDLQARADSRRSERTKGNISYLIEKLEPYIGSDEASEVAQTLASKPKAEFIRLLSSVINSQRNATFIADSYFKSFPSD